MTLPPTDVNTQAPEPEIPEILQNQEYLRDLAGYYKWVVTLALFVLTVSLSLAGLFPEGLDQKWLLVIGWLLLGLCVFLNWVLIKRLITLPIVLNTPRNNHANHHRLFLATITNTKAYGLIQNLAFLLGSASIGLAFIINVIFD